MVETTPTQTVKIPVEVDLANAQNLLTQLMEIIDRLGDYASKVIGEEINESQSKMNAAGRSTRTAVSKEKEEAEAESKAFAEMAGYMSTIANVGVSVIKKTFGMVESIYGQLKKSSPLLQAIEQLFNLAWMLFFMPLGNKLGEMLIPAVIELLDGVMEIWDAFEGMSLGEMFAYAIEKGVELLSTFILNVADILKGQSGLVGAIGRSLELLGNFIENTGVQFLESIVGLMNFIIEHLKEIISTIIAFKVASLTMQAISMYVDAVGHTIGGWMGAGIVAATAGAAFVLSEAGMSNLGVPGVGTYAEGGYIPATPGGQLAIIGEGGEGEYIIPESKMSNVGGNTYNITVNSYSKEETENMVRGIIRDEVSASRLRSGF